ncbi:MAG: LacI family transcriptional regulator [Chloroflexi bacterium]|nr:LacI family transcriptional regulator [Chloroflexota bacterium]
MIDAINMSLPVIEPPETGLTSFLRRHPKKTLVLIAQDLAHWYAGEIAASANLAATASGHRVVSLDFRRSPARERELLDAVRDTGVSGLIFLWDHSPSNLDLYTSLVEIYPCVQIIDPKPIAGLDFVGIDEYSGALLAMRHLINLGYREIGYVSLCSAMQTIQGRKQGYADALAQARLPMREEWVVELPYGLSVEDQRNRVPLIKKFLRQPQRPKALFICADWVASEVIECAHELALSVPEDFAVVGFDDALPYSLTSVPLTTMRVDLHQVGRLAVERLLLRVRDGARFEPGVILIPPILVVRESSARTTATTERWAFVLRHMQENFLRDISAREIASMIGLDPHYFSHQFCRIYGRRFTEYINELRLEYAAQLLTTTDLTVEAVARAAGFGGVNHFYVLFKRTYHLSPHAFRTRGRVHLSE